MASRHQAAALFLAFLIGYNFIAATEIKIGILLTQLPWSVSRDERLLPAFQIAQETIESRVQNGSYGNFTLKWLFSPQGCSFPVNAAVGAAARLYFEEDVAAFFGPPCSKNIMGVGDLAAELNLPIFSGSASSHELDYKARFPTLTQTTFRAGTMVSFLKKLFAHYGWKSFVLLRGGDLFNISGQAIENGLREAGIKTFVNLVKFDTNGSETHTILKEASVLSQSKYI